MQWLKDKKYVQTIDGHVAEVIAEGNGTLLLTDGVREWWVYAKDVKPF